MQMQMQQTGTMHFAFINISTAALNCIEIQSNAVLLPSKRVVYFI